MRRRGKDKKRGKWILLTVSIFFIAFFAVLGVLIFTEDEASEKNAQAQEKTTETKPETETEHLLSQMTLEEKIYQMFFVIPEAVVGGDDVTAADEDTAAALKKQPVGGLIYFSENIETSKQTKKLTKKMQSYSEIPLFIGVDEEGGSVARIGNNPDMGTSNVKTMQEIGKSGDAQKAYDAGKTLGKDLKNLGFNVDFAPVADVLTNSANTEIGDRSFGSDPELVADMVKQLVKGLHSEDIASVVKHFPGHGSTQDDSHHGYSQSTRTLKELQNCEFLPFEAGIDEGTDFVLVSHMTLVNAVSEDVPASLSEEVVTQWLREDLGYEGIAITDALRMEAVSSYYTSGEAAVLAVKAGNDMLLTPEDLTQAFTAVRDAVTDGEISEESIDASVKRILTVKAKYGLI